jgi:hypothetical protein
VNPNKMAASAEVRIISSRSFCNYFLKVLPLKLSTKNCHIDMVINILEVIIVIFEEYTNITIYMFKVHCGLLVYFKLGQISRSLSTKHLFSKNDRNHRPKRRIV